MGIAYANKLLRICKHPLVILLNILRKFAPIRSTLVYSRIPNESNYQPFVFQVPDS